MVFFVPHRRGTAPSVERGAAQCPCVLYRGRRLLYHQEERKVRPALLVLSLYLAIFLEELYLL